MTMNIISVSHVMDTLEEFSLFRGQEATTSGNERDDTASLYDPFTVPCEGSSY